MSSFISVPYFRLKPTQNYILHHARYYITYTPKAMQVTSLSCASLCVNHEFLHRLRITDILDLCYQIVMEWIILSRNSDFTLLMLFWYSLCECYVGFHFANVMLVFTLLMLCWYSLCECYVGIHMANVMLVFTLLMLCLYSHC